MRVPAARRCALRGILLRGDVRIDIDFQSVVGFVAWIKLENFERNGDEEENRDDTDDADDHVTNKTESTSFEEQSRSPTRENADDKKSKEIHKWGERNQTMIEVLN